MDLLTAIGQITKRRTDLLSQAKRLALKVETQENLESRMTTQSKVLVDGLRNKLIKWEEYERALTDKIIVAALAAVYLGADNSQPAAKMEKAWPTILGDMLPPLITFIDETRNAINDGRIIIGSQTEEFREGVSSWAGLISRVIRYLANPSYSFFQLGTYYTKQEQGYREMVRHDRGDGRVCPDCAGFSSLGWQPVGSLPMPGRECQCYDRCRCRVEYR